MSSDLQKGTLRIAGQAWQCPFGQGAVGFFLVCLFVFNIYLFIYLFWATLGLRCCARAFSSCGERGLLFIAVRGLRIAVASLVVEHGL